MISVTLMITMVKGSIHECEVLINNVCLAKGSKLLTYVGIVELNSGYTHR